MKKKHLKMKKNAKIIIIITICIVAIISLLFAFNKKPTEENKVSNTTPEITETASGETYDFSSYKKINPEYLGELSFDSGLIVEKAVQTTDNEKYLNYAWNLEQSSHGSVYLDYRNKLEDQNLIFYGHYVYADESLIFGPLHELIKQENYEANKNITLRLENEERHYVVTNVYYYEMNSETLKYYHPNYDEEYFETYINAVKEKQFYDTKEELSFDDNWITLQTCVRDRNDLRLIVLAKQI